MAKSNNKGRSAFSPHVRLHQWMMRSQAWQSLKPGPRALLVALYALYNGDNNGDLFLSEREAAKRCNISKSTAAKYFKELEEKGFTRARVKGSFNVKAPEATSWILTEFSYSTKSPTKDFMSWKPPQKQNTGVKFRSVGSKKYARTPDNVTQIISYGGKI